MKAIKQIWLPVLVGALTFTACSEEVLEEQTPAPVKHTVSFTASSEDGASRASISNGTSIVWNEGDSISVLSAGENNLCTLSSGVGTTEGSFTGTCETGTDIYAVYPYSAKNKNDDYFLVDWNGINQTAVLGSFPYQTPMVAYTPNVEQGATTIPLAFKNVCGFIKFTTDYACKKVVLKAHDENIGLASDMLILNFEQDGNPTILMKYGNASDSITLAGKDGANLVAGTYYIAVKPGYLEHGFELTFTNIYEEKTYTKSTSKSATIKRGTVLNVGTISIKSEMIHLSGTGTEEDPYLIRDFGNLEEMSDFVNYSTGGADCFKLANDIDGEGNTLTPIGTPTNPFRGIFDGNGKTISNIKLDQTKFWCIADVSGFNENYNHVTAFFGVIKDAYIKNVTIDQMRTFSFTRSEIYFNNTVVISPFIGIVLGDKEDKSLVSNITIAANQNIDLAYVSAWSYYRRSLVYGGLVGASFANLTVEKCTNNYNLSTDATGFMNFLGGIIGTCMGGQKDDGGLDFDAKVYIDMCRNFGNITVNGTTHSPIWVGGIAGYICDETYDDDVKVQITNCVNFGNLKTWITNQLTKTDNQNVITYVAGIVGEMDSDGFGSENPLIFNCVNNGDITSRNHAAGICAATYDTDTQIQWCANTGAVTSESCTPYSISGRINGDQYCGTVKECWNTYTSCTNMSGDASNVFDSDNNVPSAVECCVKMNELIGAVTDLDLIIKTWNPLSTDDSKINLIF